MNAEENPPPIDTHRHELRHEDLTRRVIGVFYDVYNELGHGFLESVYENALAIALRAAGLRAEQQHALGVWFRGQQVGDFRADCRAVLAERGAAVLSRIDQSGELTDEDRASLLVLLKEAADRRAVAKPDHNPGAA